MLHKSKNNKESYVSCIKINGVPLLPPLISPSKRKELQKDKEQAILIENKLRYKQIEKLLELPPKSNELANNDLIDLDKSLTYVPYKNLQQRTRHLSLDIVDVTEFNPGNPENKTSDPERSETASETTDITVVEDPSSIQNKPRLIRSNSYTIDNPSPILLAHLEKNKTVTTSETSFLTGKNLFPRDNSLKLDLDMNDTSPESLYTTPLSESLMLDSQIEETSNLELHQTDVIIQQITVHADANSSLFDTNITPIKKNIEAPHSFVDETECQLLQILKDIPENYSKQILELIQKQKSEQQKRIESYEFIKKQLLNDDVPNGVIKDIPVNNLSFVASTQLKKKDSEPNSAINTPSEFYTLSNSSATINFPSSPSVKLIDLEDEDYNVQTPRVNGVNDSNSNANISRELFPKIDAAQEKRQRQEWAASVIGAHVKGYLTRRLMKTVKVRSLMDTIQETLLCAVQLHNADTIDEYDIELHRRLVQQVTAACYAFHDVFFALSVKEQMMLISADRQYKLEKARRNSISSRSSTTPSSNRSSINKKVSNSRRSSTTKA